MISVGARVKWPISTKKATTLEEFGHFGNGFGALSEEFTNSSETIEEDECRESQLSFINHLPLDLTRLRGDYVGSAFRRIFPQLSNSSRHPSNLDLKVAKMSEFFETSFKIGS